MQALGFDAFVDQIKDASDDHKTLATVGHFSLQLSLDVPLTCFYFQAERKKKISKKGGGSGLSEEEMLRLQEEMLLAAKTRFEAGIPAPGPPAAKAE